MCYKILSLDGGASWSMVQARVLQDLYGDITGHELLRKFNMVIANSGGAVFLGLLCNNTSLSDIIKFYNNSEEVGQVFPPLVFGERIWQQLLRHFDIIGSKYSTSRKLHGLRTIFKKLENMQSDDRLDAAIVDTYLDNLPGIIKDDGLEIIIAAFDYNRQRVIFFRSNAGSKTDQFSGKYYRITLGEAIHASCNAPINYYDAPAKITRSLINGEDTRSAWYWDGAVAGFNNPVLAGLVEAITNNPSLEMQAYRILSLGTHQSFKANMIEEGTSTDKALKERFRKNKGRPLVEWEQSFSFFKDIKKMAASILSDPPDSATFMAYSFLNPSLQNEHANMVRINPRLGPELIDGLYECPKAYKGEDEKLKKLLKMDFDISKQQELDLINEMCDRFIVEEDGKHCLSNQLIRGDQTSEKYIGDRSYKEAKKRWKRLDECDDNKCSLSQASHTTENL